MSVLIQGMEMPEPGSYLIRLYVREDGGADIWGVGTFIPKEPLSVVSVPPHGRLIDADALMDEAYQPGAYGYVDAIQIDNAPTIIPAEEVET